MTLESEIPVPESSKLPAGPHAEAKLLTAGPPPAAASATALLVHGRGGSARDMLGLAGELDHPGIAYLAPQASGSSWYPCSFLAPLAENQPHLGSALSALAGIVARLEGEGVGPERLALIGFSQGACLTLEFVARHPRRYGAVAALTGGLIGPPGTPRSYPGSLAGTPVFLGAGDPDPHVPWSRVEESAEVLARMGAAVVKRRYPGLPHAMNSDEIAELDRMLGALAGARPGG